MYGANRNMKSITETEQKFTVKEIKWAKYFHAAKKVMIIQ